MKEWKNNPCQPLVSISCITYNHEKYIEDALQGFLSQETDFPFEILIHDDASTDRTVNILREYEVKYPKLIKPIYQKENQYSRGIKISATYQYPRALGKYIAMCEGDDYWIDPYKLQKQVDFLEANPDYGMTYSKVIYFIQKKNKYDHYFGGDKETFEELLFGNSVPTLTACFRLDLFQEYQQDIKPETRNWLMGDYPMWLYFAQKNKIKYENRVTGVYRVLVNSASHSTDTRKEIDFKKNYIDIADFFCDKYCKRNATARQKFDLYYAWMLFRIWTKWHTPKAKQQIMDRILNKKGDKSLKLKLIQFTFSFPIFRYVFVIYDKIGLVALRQKLMRYRETPE